MHDDDPPEGDATESPDAAGAADPSDALSVLADETRVAILRALADADEPLSFTRLRERAGVRDSGRFGYHLRRLCEYFVRETPEGYELGGAGARLVDATGAGGDAVSRVVDGTDGCPVCGEADCGRLFHVHLAPGP